MTAPEVGPVQDVWARPHDLRFDPENPRMPLMRFDDEIEAVKFMLVNYDVDELVRSILVTGWLDFEPLIVKQPTQTVLEGNRRLAALKLMVPRSFGSKQVIGYLTYLTRTRSLQR
jgi:hypothetical protein